MIETIDRKVIAFIAIEVGIGLGTIYSTQASMNAIGHKMERANRQEFEKQIKDGLMTSKS